MIEKDLEEKACTAIRQACPGAKIYKNVGSSFSKGRPDRTVTWGGRTSWLEFKHLKHGQKITDDDIFEPGQLIELVQLEGQSQSRSWVIAYRTTRNEKSLEMYRPTAILHKRLGIVEHPRQDFRDLHREGWMKAQGYAHHLVAQLIYESHR